MSVIEQIKEGRRLARMRMGQDAPEFVVLPTNQDIRMAIVPLTEREYESALSAAAALRPEPVDQPENTYGTETRDRFVSAHMLADALREPGDIEKKVFASAEELIAELEPGDINFLRDEYARISEFSSPELDGFDEERLEELKKAFEKIDLSVLSGKTWWHLKSFFSNLTPEQLAASLYGSSSTRTLTGMTENEKSTPGASPS